MVKAKKSKKDVVNTHTLFFKSNTKVSPIGLEIVERSLKELSFDYIKTNNQPDNDYNIYAYVNECGELETKKTKRGDEIKMINLKLIDEYYDHIKCVLWGDLAVAFQPNNVDKVIILKTVQSRIFQQEIYIQSNKDTIIYYDPNTLRAKALSEKINIHFHGKN